MISKLGKLLSVLMLGFFCSVTPSRATPLNLVLNLSPDIFSNGIDVTYDSVNDLLNASGWAQLIKPPASIAGPITGGGFFLTAPVDSSGALQPGGTVTILGTIPSFMSGTLLTGNLTSFGSNGKGAPFEFIFTVTGGA